MEDGQTAIGSTSRHSTRGTPALVLSKDPCRSSSRHSCTNFFKMPPNLRHWFVHAIGRCSDSFEPGELFRWKNGLWHNFKRRLWFSISLSARKQDRIIIFIDGLDEFDVGDHPALVKLVQRLCGSFPTELKICVTSRPGHSSPMLSVRNPA